MTLLQKASQIVDGGRDGNHGGINENLTQTALLWSAYLGHTITKQDVGVMMTLLKLARYKANPDHPDHLVDAAGWIGCTGEIEGE